MVETIDLTAETVRYTFDVESEEFIYALPTWSQSPNCESPTRSIDVEVESSDFPVEVDIDPDIGLTVSLNSVEDPYALIGTETIIRMTIGIQDVQNSD